MATMYRGSERLVYVRAVALIFFITILGFGLMYAPAVLLPLSDSNLNYFMFSVLIIALGLAVPYWILKLGMHSAHRHNAQERELSLKDIPDDQDQRRNS